MSDATVSFGVEIADETGASGVSAISQLEQLRGKLDADTQALAQMQKALKNLQGGSAVSIAQFRQLRQQIADQKIVIAGAQSKYISLGGTFDKMPTKELATGLESLKTGLLGATGPIGSMSGSVAGLVSKLGSAGLVGVVVLAVAALIALGIALAAAAVSMAKFALANASLYREQSLTLEAMTKIPNWWGIAAGKADQLMASTNLMAATYGLARTQVMGFTKDLYAVGYRGKNLQRALESTSIATAAFGGDVDQANKYMGAMSWQFGFLGKASAGFAARVKHDLGDLATRQALGFSKQMAKLHENVGLLFGGIKIEGFLKSLNTVLSLFGETTVSGKLMKGILEDMFNPLFGSSEGAGIAVKHMIQDMIYWVLVAEGHWLDLQLWVAKTFDYKGDLGTLLALTSIKIALGGVLFVAGLVALAFASIGIAIAATALIVLAPLILAGLMLLGIYKGAKLLYNYDWSGLGKWMVQGIADGITGAAGVVWNAIKGIGTGAIKLLKSILGIHSPSLVMRAQIGYQMPLGMAAGIRQGTPQVHAAVREMVEIPANAQPSVGSYGGGSRASAASAPNNYITITVDGARSPADTAREIYEVLCDRLQIGLAQTGGAHG